MKTLKLLIVILATTFVQNLSAQEKFNKWSVELQAGYSNISRNLMTSIYYTNHFTPSHVNLGFRYMFNPTIGLKLNAGYDGIKTGDIDSKKSSELKGSFLNANLQGVINLTSYVASTGLSNRLGVLLHGGAGISNMILDRPLATPMPGFLTDDNDVMINLIYGATIMYRVSDKIAITADYSRREHFYNRLKMDGYFKNDEYIDSNISNFTLGLTFYLGKKDLKHADWVTSSKDETKEDDKNAEVDALKERVANLENTNNKGADMSAIERMIKEKTSNTNAKEQDIAKELINNGYIAAYFDFNKAEPTNESTEGIDFVLNYLRKNPNSKITVSGYADEKGEAGYNDKLSLRRAENVKTTLEKGGISPSRVTVVAGGQDKSVEIDSEWARNTVRKVLFKVQ
jgi:OOP family OmpA-OmpF porin